MMTEQQEVARYRVEDQLRRIEARAIGRNGRPRTTLRTRVAHLLRRIADRLEPASRRLTEPQPRHRGTGLSIVR
ncbi:MULTISPECIES: hypothetical protein [Kribbella]|jgi:hypothetical protein|uniref:Uncharacterized protein n=1 Tax=Kribbella pratensis TaxID=2512112 RepID=A0ABY2FDB6_9ACTN|nr:MULTISPECIES: hypothetical protein [Kribbella]TDW81096.1 hypothetical protein EV647_7738 [Kribbella sp. VKM Ac-2566]TDW89357.1 hypothetical protein EV137_3151 [Kribbella pratensis]